LRFSRNWGGFAMKTGVYWRLIAQLPPVSH
jgi:hypothetical protein